MRNVQFHWQNLYVRVFISYYRCLTEIASYVTLVVLLFLVPCT